MLAGSIAQQWLCPSAKGARCFWKADREKCLALNQGISGHWFRASTAISCASSSPHGGLSA